MSSSIGSVQEADLLTEARRWQQESDRRAGDPHSPDPAPWTHDRLKAVAESRAQDAGGLVVCSGGTTGAPKRTVLAPDLGVPRVVSQWRPLQPGDVLLNLFSTGKMWGAQYFYNAVALHCRSTVAPMGALNAQEFDEWSDEIVAMGVNAIAGAPNVLAGFAEAVRASGVELPIRTVIWSGEPMTRARATAIRSAFPGAGLWGNYGSIETFVIGVSRPDCALGALHLLSDQSVEPQEDGALLTRVGDGWPVPAWRFRLGDRLRPTTCPCGEGDAFEVLGRADDNVKLYGGMVGVGDVLEKAGRIEGLGEVQLVLYRDPEVPSAVVGMRLRYTGPNPDTGLVRDRLVHSIEDLEILDRHTPEAVVVDRVPEVERSPRTNKVLPVVWRSARNVTEMAGADA